MRTINGCYVSRFTRVMSSFFMRASSVVGLRPRILAAPFSPLTRQLVCSSTSTICCRSISSSVKRLRLTCFAIRGGKPLDRLQLRSFAQDHRALNHMFQFPDVPRPLVALERRHHPFGNPIDFLAEVRGELAHEILHQQRNVALAFAQRGEMNRKHIEAVVEIRAIVACLRESGQDPGSSPRSPAHSP